METVASLVRVATLSRGCCIMVLSDDTYSVSRMGILIDSWVGLLDFDPSFAYTRKWTIPDVELYQGYKKTLFRQSLHSFHLLLSAASVSFLLYLFLISLLLTLPFFLNLFFRSTVFMFFISSIFGRLFLIFKQKRETGRKITKGEENGINLFSFHFFSFFIFSERSMRTN